MLVIGASGFLGRHVRDRACAEGLTVTTAGRSGLSDSHAHCLIDLAAVNPARLAAVLTALDPDVVVNCAGATRGDVDVLAGINVTGTCTLVRAMLMTGRPARLVHLGSAAEYGASEPGTAVAESAPARPAGAYGVTKLAGTRLVELGRAAGLDAVVLRVFNPVGPGAPDTILPGRAVAELRRAVTSGTEVQLGSLEAVRDFVDARDVADAAIAAARAPSLPDAVLNVGSGRGVPARALVKELAVISGYGGPVVESPVVESPVVESPVVESPVGGSAAGGPAAFADLSWQQADIGLARRDLGWEPRHDLTTSLADLWEDCCEPG
jgi:nucleoside-diphosphate-sugar epimerase